MALIRFGDEAGQIFGFSTDSQNRAIQNTF
jgi:hypothetical protein